MAIIGKIREKSILLVMIIGLALLAFILSDYKNMFGVNEGEYGIGHVFGEKVDQVKYNTLYQKLKNQLLQNPQVRRDEIDKIASEQAWSQLMDSAADLSILPRILSPHLHVRASCTPLPAYQHPNTYTRHDAFTMPMR